MRLALLIGVPGGIAATFVMWWIGERLSPDAIAMAIGLLLGVLSGVPAAALVLAALRGGDLALTVTVNYLDDFNQPQAFSDTLTISVAEPVTEDETAVSSPSDTPPEDEGFLGKLWRFVRGMLGLGS